MSIPLLIGALIIIILTVVLYVRIESRFRNALTSIEEKTAGKLMYYRNTIRTLLSGNIDADGLLCFSFYVLLHLSFPLLGFALLLRTDLNFLVVLLSLIWSYQLFHRLFPGYSRGVEDEDELDSAETEEN